MQSPSFHSVPGALLFAELPHLRAVQPEAGKANHLYINSSDRLSVDDGLPHGLGIGGYANPRYPDGDFRFFVSFKGAPYNGASDGTFGAGKLSPDEWNGKGQLQDLVVLAVGSEDDVKAGIATRDEYRLNEAKRIAKARKVDKAQFLDDFKSGLHESKAFAHQGHVDRGRVGEDCRDDNPNEPA
ncbi:hypothetical protein TeGR_g10893 [Tetraparma gracilis]|uniref:Uncharacterized protein n=1 Tax=Tetraparma gracilis TaxID=2962635 RepID=A0ABQ6MK39_9STRA|nr:hypothetical protein TeGR_g10893 [Tetraparma gracilis]